jgi:alpha-tubulin suppressor-like RCC1 family protein/sugar lactone lactonase YvrE
LPTNLKNNNSFMRDYIQLATSLAHGLAALTVLALSSLGNAQSSLTTLVGRATAGTPTFNGRCDYNNTPAIGDTITVSAESIARMSDGSYVIFDRGANCIHRLSGGNLTTIAGNGTVGDPIDGLATTTPMRSVSGLAVAADGTIFYSDSDNNVIRKFTIGGNVSTVAGSATAGYVSTGYDNTISLAAARFNNPFGLALDSAGNLFVAEWRGRCVKRIDNAASGGGGATGVTRIAGYCATDGGGLPGGVFNDNVAAQDAVFDQLPALAFDTAGNLYIAEAVNRSIRKITAGANNLIDPTDLTTTIAGTGALGSSGDGGLATSAVFSTVLGVAVDAGGSVHFGDIDTHRIRRVHTAGGISTSIGTGSAGYGADTTGNLTALAVSRPNGFVIDPDGSIVFADQDNFRIRRMTLDATADAFSFNALTNVPVNTAITSNIVVPTGFDSPASIQIANGSYSIGCNGTFTTNAGSINPGQSVCVRVTSASAGNTTTTASLTVGSVAANFAATTQTVTLTGTITAISVGDRSTCIVIDGGVQCWGQNNARQLGNGNGDPQFTSAIPVQAIPAGSGATAVSVGQIHVCAVVAGGVKCWGNGTLGQLGNGTTGIFPSPVNAVGLGAGSGVTQVGVGLAHSCAITNGSAFCWGDDSSGRMGTSGASSLVPLAVNAPGNSGVTSLAVGKFHTCLMINGAPYCAGSGLANLQALNVNVSTVSPSTLPGLNFAAEIGAQGAGEFSCFRRISDGAVICYGSNLNGRLGNGSPTGTSLAFVVPDSATAVSAGVNHACAIVDGGLFCWGLNTSGQTGLPTNITAYFNANPLPAYPSGSGVTHIAAGAEHTCAVANGRVRCWGNNTFARLGVFYDVNLSLTKSGSGTGLVTSSVGGINCGTACSSVAPFSINVNTSVTLSALADAGMTFTGWSGATCNEGQTSATCTFATGGNPGATNAATANFSAIAFTGTVLSRKQHGAYPGELTIAQSAPFNAATIEPRSIGSGHNIIFRFTNAVTGGTASVTDAMDVPIAGATATPSFSGNDLIVTLTNIADATRVKVKVANVNGSLNIEAPVAFLYGDVTQTGKVTAADISALKARGNVTQVGNGDYLFDINVNGGLNNTDVSAVKAKAGNTLP